MIPSLNWDFPQVFYPAFEPHRYKVFYGGRGASRSWSVARALLIKGVQSPLRWLCARELQKSIEDSVHQLLSDQIRLLGLESFYRIEKAHIYGANGTVFSFAGLRNNVTEIKSHEGADGVWVEEANKVTKQSWDILIPTIRKDNSEIWVTFNPELDTDETYKRFVVNPYPDSLVVKMTYKDNPWFPNVLETERTHCKERDPDGYLTIWEGNTRLVLEGAIYANELRAAYSEGRVCKVRHDQTRKTHTYWDLGYGDFTSIWFAQSYSGEFKIIDFLQNRLKPTSWYMKELNKKPYTYDTHWLPHDSEQEHQAAEGRTVRSTVDSLSGPMTSVVVLPSTSIDVGIRAAREVFPMCLFDEEKTMEGLNCLRRYAYEVDQDGRYSRKPNHDDASHAADAFRYLAMSITMPTETQKRRYTQPKFKDNLAWVA